MSEKVYIRDLSDSALKATVKLALFTIGVPKNKIEALDTGEVNNILFGVRKYQGGMWIDSFEQAFHEYAAGNIELVISGEPSPKLIGRICKAFKELNNPKRDYIPAESNNQAKWKVFIKFIGFYGHIPEGSDWISLWNYLYTKNKLTSEKQLTPIVEWSHERYALAERDVKEFVIMNWSEHLHGGNLFTGKRDAGNLNIGQRLRQSLSM